jgi:hypothetical protein
MTSHPFREQFLKSTSLTPVKMGPGPQVSGTSELGARRAFNRSAYLAARYEFAAEAEIKKCVERLFSALGIEDDAGVQALAKQRLQRVRLWEFNKELGYATPKPGEDEIGQSARNFFGAQVLFGLLADPLDPGGTYPTVVVDILRKGAEGLFKLGEAQFRALAKLACNVCDWAIVKGLRSLVVIESPLGNSVPSQVIEEIAGQRGLAVVIVEWGCPRNDKVWRGETVKSAAKTLSKDSRVMSADCVLFVDDALTGSRVLKMAAELRRAVGPNRFAAVAMQFRYPEGSGRASPPTRDLGLFTEWASGVGLPYGVLPFPDMPLFDVDEEGKCYLEKPMAWGGTDLIAGKKEGESGF